MPHRLTARDVMSRDFPILEPQQTIAHAVQVLLKAHKRGAAVVGPGKRLLGVLSEKDCLKAFAAAVYHKEFSGTVGDYMSTQVMTVDANIGIMQVVELFLQHPYFRFPVLDDGELVGMISRRSVLEGLNSAGVWADENRQTHAPIVGAWFGKLQGKEGSAIPKLD